jgi:hypothetical protein
MLFRALSLSLVALAVALFLTAQVSAQKAANTHEGTVVKATAKELIMKDKAGKEHKHTLALTAKVTCDGKACRLEDLKEGQKVRVTTQADNPTIAIRVEALDKQRTFSPSGSR